MTDPQKSTLRGAALAILGFALFSTHDAFVKHLGQFYAPMQIIFFSVLFSFPLAILMLMRDTTRAHLRPVHPGWSALRTASIVITGLSAFYAFSVLPLAQVYSIIFTAPLLITLLSIPVLGERVGPHRLGAVAAGFAGVMIVLRPGEAEITLGHGAAMLAAFGAASSSVVVRRIGRDERSAVLMLYPMMANFVAMAALMPASYLPMPIWHLGLVGVVSLLAFAATLLIIAAYRAGEAAIIAPMQYSQLLWAAVYGGLIFGERPDQYTWIGAGVIVASGLYVVIRESTVGASRNTPVLRTRARFDAGTGPRLPQKDGGGEKNRGPLANDDPKP